MESPLYEGKCKKIFPLPENQVRMEFKDNLTAYNGKKKSSFPGKGALNRNTSSLIFQYLQSLGCKNHWIKDHGTQEMICQTLQMIPLEVVVRNTLAGSTAKKFQKKEGEPLLQPLFELYYKDETLGDPFISSEQARMLNIFKTPDEEQNIQNQALDINQKLKKLFAKVGLDLIDFKLEFGKNKEKATLLGDEISADSCRIWDMESKKRLDKDRFRLDLGKVQEGYKEIYQRLLKAV